MKILVSSPSWPQNFFLKGIGFQSSTLFPAPEGACADPLDCSKRVYILTPSRCPGRIASAGSG